MIAEARMVHSQRWATAFARRGWQVTMLSVQPRPIEGVEVLPLSVPRFGPGNLRGWWGRYANVFRSAIARRRPDLVHIHYLHAYPPEAFRCRRQGRDAAHTPLVVSTWGADIIQDETVPNDTPEQRERKATLLRNADAVTATTHYLADCTAEYAGIDHGDITVIPFGVDLQQYARPVDRARPATPRIGFIKHLLVKYGPDRFVRAMPEIVRRAPSAGFVMIGSGDEEGNLRSLAFELGVQDRIDWRGQIDNHAVAEALWDMDVLVMPSVSHSETFGVVAVEAQAAGVPVVFSDLPGVREAVHNGVGGLAVPPGDVDALAAVVCRLIEQPDLRDRLRTSGRRFVERYFDFERNVDQMERVYESVTQLAAALP